jgi:osmotically-inducible protein OsmY
MRSTKWLIVGSALALSLTACDRAPDQRSSADKGPIASAEKAIDRTQQVASDATITAKVKSKFVADDQLKAHEINVDTKNGIVTLRGSVADPNAKDRAAVVAREVDGVTSVNNELIVRSS